MENRCVICGEIIPEGRMVCPICEKKMTWEEYLEIYDYKQELNKQVGVPIAVTLLFSTISIFAIVCLGLWKIAVILVR